MATASIQRIALSLLTANILFVATPALAEPMPFSAEPFSDIDTRHPDFQAVDWLRRHNILTADENGRVDPDMLLSRSAFVTLLTSPLLLDPKATTACVSNEPETDDPHIFFSDVLRSDPYAAHLCIAYVRKIVSGYPDHMFRPVQPIVFAEGAKILSTVFRGKDTNDTDPQGWYVQYVNWLSDDNVIPVSVKSLTQPLTRAQTAEMLWRILTHQTNLPATHFRVHVPVIRPISRPEEQNCSDGCPIDIAPPGRIPHPRVFENSGGALIPLQESGATTNE